MTEQSSTWGASFAQTPEEYVYACYAHADLRNKTAKDGGEAYNTAYEQLVTPLLHVASLHFCALTNPGPSAVKCEGPIFRWKTLVHSAPRGKA